MEHQKALDEESSRHMANADDAHKKSAKLEVKVTELLATLEATTKDLAKARDSE